MNKKINDWRYEALNDHEIKQKAVKLPHFKLLQRFEDKLEATDSREDKKNIVSETFEWAYSNDYKVFYVELRNLLKQRVERARKGITPRVTQKEEGATVEEAKALFS